MASHLRQMRGPALVLMVFLVAEAAGLLCGRDCSNVCQNGSCDRFLQACKTCNSTSCGAPTPTTEKPAAQTGVIIGAAAGAAVLVVIVVVIVAVIVVKRRTAGGKGQAGDPKSSNPYENPGMRREDENPYDAPYAEAQDVPDLPNRPANMSPTGVNDYVNSAK